MPQLTRPFLVALALVCVMASGAHAGQGGAFADRDFDAMDARLVGRGVPAAVLIRDAERIAAGYRPGSEPGGAFGRRAARRSLAWLTRAGLYYGRDEYVAQALFRAYGALGVYYGGGVYGPAAYVAYASAARLAQRMVLQGVGSGFAAAELDRVALAYGTLAVGHGHLFWPWGWYRDLPESAAMDEPPVPELTMVAFPKIETAGLTSDERAALGDLRTRFSGVAARVHQARQLMARMESTLMQRGFNLRAQDSANALKMQSFLETAAELAAERQFQEAEVALTRADYVREQLKGITGQ